MLDEVSQGMEIEDKMETRGDEEISVEPTTSLKETDEGPGVKVSGGAGKAEAPEETLVEADDGVKGGTTEVDEKIFAAPLPSCSTEEADPDADQDADGDGEGEDGTDEPGQASGLPPSSSRLMRNLAEKMRRDKLNMYISELSSLVPIVAMATKRMDKTSVLRLSANFLRIHLSLKQNKKPETPRIIPEGLESTLSSTLLEALEGFMLIVTSSGKIVYVSDSVEKLLGHSQLDLMGQSLYSITHTGDTELLRHHLQPSSEFDASATSTGDEGSDAGSSSMDYVPRSPSFFGGRPEDAFSGLAAGERRSFYVRLAERSMARGDPARHVTVHLIGILRPSVNKKETPKPATKGKKDSSSASSSTSGSGDEHLLVCVARPFRNKGITELSLMEAVQDEYVTRHMPDGRIIYSDHRIAFVAGYLTEEVMGHSAFNFIHNEDLPWATVANRQMFSSVEGQGYSVYRLTTKTGSLIHLRTRGFLEFNKTTQKVETFVCINTLLTIEEGDKELEKERERITPFITFQQVTSTTTNAAGNPAILGNSAQAAMSTSGLDLAASPIDQHQLLSPASTLISTSTRLTLDVTGAALAGGSNHMSGGVSIEEVPEGELGSPGVRGSEDPVESWSNAMNGSSSEGLANPISSPSGASISPGSHHSPTSPLPTNSLLTVGSPSDEALNQIQHSIVYITHGASNGRKPEGYMGRAEPATHGNLLPRLKRSLAEDDEFLMTSSAKRSMLPSAFISSYGSLHSPHLGPKWATESSTTIIYDQHNNNG